MKPAAGYDFSQRAKWSAGTRRQRHFWLADCDGRDGGRNEVDGAGRATPAAVDETTYSEKLEFGLPAANNPVAICADEAFPRTLSNGSGRRAIELLGKSSTVGARWVLLERGLVNRNGTETGHNGTDGWCGGIRRHRRAIFRRCSARRADPVSARLSRIPGANLCRARNKYDVV
jgi:hypothetical protein